MQRILVSEIMDDEQSALAYTTADFRIQTNILLKPYSRSFDLITLALGLSVEKIGERHYAISGYI